MLGQRRQPGLQQFAHAHRMRHDPALLHQLQIAQCHGRGHRMTGIGQAVAEQPDFGRGLLDRLVHERRHGHGRDRLVGRRQRLGQGHRGRLDAERLAAEGLAGAAKAAHHFVVDEQNAVALQDRLDRLVITGGWNDQPTGTHQRLGDQGGKGLAALARDDALQFCDQARGELGLALAGSTLAEIVRLGQVDHIAAGQIEVGMKGLQTSQCSRRQGRAVVATDTRQDLLALRLTGHVEVVAQQLDLGIVGVRSGTAEQEARALDRHPFGKLCRQADAGFVGPGGKQRAIAQGLDLFSGDPRQLRLAIAQRRAPESRHALEVAPPMLILDMNTVATSPDQRFTFAYLAQVRGRMKQVATVKRGKIGGHGQESSVVDDLR